MRTLADLAAIVTRFTNGRMRYTRHDRFIYDRHSVDNSAVYWNDLSGPNEDEVSFPGLCRNYRRHPLISKAHCRATSSLSVGDSRHNTAWADIEDTHHFIHAMVACTDQGTKSEFLARNIGRTDVR